MATKEDLLANLANRGIDKNLLNKDNFTEKDLSEFKDTGSFSNTFYNQFKQEPIENVNNTQDN
jgi:hypothetical protein